MLLTFLQTVRAARLMREFETRTTIAILSLGLKIICGIRY